MSDDAMIGIHHKFDHFFIAPSNFGNSLKFFTVCLGWEVVSEWGEGVEPRGAIIRSVNGNVSVVLAERHGNDEDNAWSSGVNGTHPTIHIEVSDIEARYRQIPRGEHLVVPLQTTHWGAQWFVVKDPDNNLIAFFSPKKK
jgi:uncharacterized glyoxalase superfamily protein PhnB